MIYLILMGLLTTQATYTRNGLFSSVGNVVEDTTRVAGAPFRAVGGDDLNIVSAPAYAVEGAGELVATPLHAIDGDENDDFDDEE